MFNNQKVVVTMTSWSKRIGNCVKVIQSILDNTVNPDIVFLNLSLEEFPNRLKDLPRDLVELSLKNPMVKIGFDADVQTIFTDTTVIDIGTEEEIDSRFIFNYIQSNVNNNQYDVIVSLTSFPNRFKNANLIIKCLNSLVYQKTQYRYHIVMTLFKDDIPLLPSEVLEFCLIHDIEILPCCQDIRGNKKFFYVCQKYPNNPIIMVDDDLIFFDNLVDSLMNKYMTQKNVIWTGWCQILNINKDGKLYYCESLMHNSNDETPSFRYKFGSGSGTLIPPHLIDDFHGILKLIYQDDNIFHDELILKKCSLDKGVKVGLCLNTKYKCTIGGWLTHTQFIQNEIQQQVESPGNLHSINCSKINIGGKLIYRGMKTEMNLLGHYIIRDNEVNTIQRRIS